MGEADACRGPGYYDIEVKKYQPSKSTFLELGKLTLLESSALDYSGTEKFRKTHETAGSSRGEICSSIIKKR